MGFMQLLKLTVSGFALNYATPVGLLGGEAYRIMELSKYIGVQRATSSVILFAMMHIFAHFWFWVTGVVAYWVLALTGDVPMNSVMGDCIGAHYSLLLVRYLSFHQRIQEWDDGQIGSLAE